MRVTIKLIVTSYHPSSITVDGNCATAVSFQKTILIFLNLDMKFVMHKQTYMFNFNKFMSMGKLLRNILMQFWHPTTILNNLHFNLAFIKPIDIFLVTQPHLLTYITR